jgi:methylmalonyl-CoA/ethylmalonyl-CoA epimerase
MERKKSPILLGDPLQIAFIVKDAHRTAELLETIFGIGSFVFEDWPPSNRPEFERFVDGKPSEHRTLLAFASWNNLEIELIENVEGTSGYSEYLAEKGEGVHHLLFEVDDLEKTIEAFAERGIGVKMGATGRKPGTRWVLLDTNGLFGCSIEIRNKMPKEYNTA